MSDGNDITIKDVYELVDKKIGEVFEALNRDRDQCRTRHTEIDRQLSATTTQNGVQDKTIGDHENRQRTGERFMYLLGGGFTVLNAVIGLLFKIL